MGAVKMKKASIAALLGAAALVVPGIADAAVVPAKPVPTVVQAAAAASVPAQPLAEPSLEEPVSFTAADVARAASPAGAAPPVTVAVAGAVVGHSPQAALARKDAPFHSYLLDAGRFVLDVGSLSQRRAEAPTVSAVPLPGALWLFGSALLAFLVISGRRKF
jgi:hypothetical protein